MVSFRVALVFRLLAAVHSWGPAFEPIRGGFGRVGIILNALGSRDSEDNDLLHNNNNNNNHHEQHNSIIPLPPAATFRNHKSLRSVDPFKADAILFDGIDWMRHFSYPEPLIWEPFEDEPEELMDEASMLWLDGDSDCTGEECEMECAIPEEYKVSDAIVADVVSFLSIQRAKPIRVPQQPTAGPLQEEEGEWE